MTPLKQLSKVQENFSQWRNSTSQHRVTPKALREEAAHLLSHHTVVDVSQALQVPLATLKTWRYNLEKNNIDTLDFIQLPLTEEFPNKYQEVLLECNLSFPQGMSLSIKCYSSEKLVQFIHALIKEK